MAKRYCWIRLMALGLCLCCLVTGCRRATSTDTTAHEKTPAVDEVGEATQPTLDEVGEATQPSLDEIEGNMLPAFDTVATNGTLAYEELKAFLEQALADKDFCDEAILLIWDTFESLYQNYPGWMVLYHDMPALDRYVYENYVRIIDKLNHLVYHDATAQETQDLLDKGDVGTWVDCEEDGPYLHIVATPAAVAEDWERKHDVECFYHEVTHIKQYNETVYFPFEFWEDEEDERMLPSNVIIEGGTSFHQRFVRPFDWHLAGSWMVSNADETVYIEYPSENASGYLIWLSDYAKLTYLVGYDVMDQLERMEITYDEFLVILCDKYGYFRGRKYMRMVTDRYYLHEESWRGDEVFQLSIDIENAFLALLQEDIEEAQTADELENIRQFYDTYKRKNMPFVVKEDGSSKLDRKKYFNIKAVSEALKEKTAALAQ